MSLEQEQIDLEEMKPSSAAEVNGHKLGLNLEAGGKRVCYTTFEDKIGCLTKDQIGKILVDPKRVASRLEFGPDWVLNQGQRSSCAPYAAAAIMEKMIWRKLRIRVKLGPEFMYAMVNGGRDNGAILRRVIEQAIKGGCARRDFVKYQSYLAREMGPEAQNDARNYRIADGEIVGLHSDDEVASALALGWLVYLAVEVQDPWFQLDADGVVAPCTGDGNHAIHADDVRISPQGEYQFDHQGSWALTYGQKGRGWISWKRHLKDTVRNHEFCAVRVMRTIPTGEQLPTPK